MKFFSWAMAMVSAMVIMCGCSENALDYVPEDADYVVYGNTKNVFDSKIWKVLKKSDSFEEDMLEKLEDELGIEKPENLLGNVAVWGKVGEEPEGAVICFTNGGADSVFDNFRKKMSNNEYLKIDKDKVDGNEAFSVYYEYEGKKSYTIGVVKVDDDVLHITFRDEASMHKKERESEVANAIDRSAIVAFATQSGAWMDIAESDRTFKEMDLDFGKAGVAKVEVFCDDDEISIKGSIDISDLED